MRRFSCASRIIATYKIVLPAQIKVVIRVMSISDVHKRLRVETASAHRRLEKRLGAIALLSSISTRGELVTRYHRFHFCVENALEPHLSDLPGLDFANRRRAAMVADDMRALGQGSFCAGDAGLELCSCAEALGGLYVLEGSTLGGQMILNQLRQIGVSLVGLDFLDPYGAYTGQYWRSFLNLLEQRTNACEQAVLEAVSGALKVFAFAEASLCQESSVD